MLYVSCMQHEVSCLKFLKSTAGSDVSVCTLLMACNFLVFVHVDLTNMY